MKDLCNLTKDLNLRQAYVNTKPTYKMFHKRRMSSTNSLKKTHGRLNESTDAQNLSVIHCISSDFDNLRMKTLTFIHFN